MSLEGSRILLRVESVREMLLFRNYPKELAPLKLEIVIDENGFNAHERATLLNAWRLIEPQKRRIGRNAFFTFLTRYEHHINFFRYNNSEIKLSALHGHAIWMMDLLEELIIYLEKPTEFHRMLQMMMPTHVTVGVHQEYMLILAEEMEKTLFECPRLSIHMTHSLENGLKKLITIVGKFNEQEGERRFMSNLKYSIMKGEESEILNDKE